MRFVRSVKILFISWDGPQTSYMEGLFMPIFFEISKRISVEFHVLQFTWGNTERIQITKNKAEKLGIIYSSISIQRKPTAIFGSLFTVFTSSKKIEKYIVENQIDIVMPRSTFPALMVNKIKRKNFKIVFDADGLPLEERIESKSLKRNSLFHKLLFKEEVKIICRADAVIVRSKYAIDYYLDKIPTSNYSKFFRVINGRNVNQFSFDETNRNRIRKQLSIDDSETLFIYVGSLGGKYLTDHIIKFAELLYKKSVKLRVLLLSNTEYNPQDTNIIYKNVTQSEVSKYLSAADFGFYFIKQSFSMTAASATKMGEYLISGLPVLGTAKIGDNDEVFSNNNFIFLHNNDLENFEKMLLWINSKDFKKERSQISEFGAKHFSLDASANSYITALKKIGI